MKVTNKMLEVIQKLKEEEIEWTLTEYFPDLEYTIEEGASDDEASLVVSFADNYSGKEFDLEFKITEEKAEINIYEDVYEDVTTETIWRHLFLDNLTRK